MTHMDSIIRQFSAEGATHLYSSPPSVLTPADLYRAKDDAHFRAAIAGSNIYLITARRRVLINPHNLQLLGRAAYGSFIVMDEQGVHPCPSDTTSRGSGRMIRMRSNRFSWRRTVRT